MFTVVDDCSWPLPTAEQLPGVEWVANHIAVAATEAVSGTKRERATAVNNLLAQHAAT